MPKPLPNYIRTHRKRHQLSQEEVAMLLGLVSGTTVTRHETNERIPTLRTAIAYAVILGASVEELFAGMVVEVESVIRQHARDLSAAQAGLSAAQAGLSAAQAGLREDAECGAETHSPELLAALERLAFAAALPPDEGPENRPE